MANFCVICSKLFCRHTTHRYEDERFVALAQFGPVETTAGEVARRQALAILEPRQAELEQRSKAEFRFSEIERQHMEALTGTIATLHGMAPVGALLPPHDGGRLDFVLT